MTERRIAFITGAGRRLGSDLCRYWHAQGWEVFGHYRSPADSVRELEALGINMLQADFDDESQVLALAQTLKDRVPHLDLIVHNASAFTRDGPDLLQNLRAFNTFFRVHMLAPYALNCALEPLLMASPRENVDIIHMTDIFADKPNPVFAAYCATKAGLANLNQSFARRMAPKVKVNAIQPGPVKFLETHSEEVKKTIIAETLLGREGGFEPVVQMIAAIVANSYMTGGSVKIDGGRALA